jgi:hypothetical protein
MLTITVYDWCGCGGLKETEWENNKQFDGTVDDAFTIARKLFNDHKLNVMLLHKPETIIVAIDNRSFGQR